MQTTITFGDDGRSVITTETTAIHKGWFIKKPPTLVASSKRRWFELYPTEIKYFSKVTEKGNGMVGRQKGSIGICKSTKVKVDGLTLKISNPDRDWSLRADEMSIGTALDLRARVRQGYDIVLDWGRSINDLAEESKNTGDDLGESVEVAKGAWEQNAGSAIAAAYDEADAEGSAHVEPAPSTPTWQEEMRPARSIFGFDEDDDEDDDGEAAEDEAAARTALKAKFDAIDTDNSGTVETAELMAAIKEDTELQRLFELAALTFRPFAGGEEFSFAEINQIAYQIDTNEDGKLQWSEFEAALFKAAVTSLPQGAPADDGDANDGFGFGFVEDGDGGMDL